MPRARLPRFAVAVAIAIAVVSAAALPFAGCSAGDGAPGSTDDGGAEATLPLDAGLADAAPAGCAGDRDPDGMWRHLSCAGLYVDFGAKRVDPALRPYRPALELWSDGAAKQRYLLLPPGTTIDTSDIDEWVFPVGTRAWKELAVDGRRVETRLYEKAASGTWRHASFRWLDDGSDAIRTDDGARIARGGPDVPPYQIPTANECNDCHSGRKDRLLGVEAVSLGLPGAEGPTLATLVAEGRLSAPPATTMLALPEDGTGAAASALGWMHVSCGPCHNRSSAATAEKSRVYTLVRASQLFATDAAPAVASLDAHVSTVGRASTFEIPDGGGATFSMIAAGDPRASLVSYLSGRRVGPTGNPNEKEQMPPIVTRLVDAKGHALLDAWITALPP